jgi:hypothetical protein
MNVSVWDLHCKLEFKNAPEQLVEIKSGKYLLTGLTTTDTDCDRNGCMKLNKFSLQTMNGREATMLRCTEQYSYDTPGTTPGPLTEEQLGVALGAYLRLQPAK